METMKPKLRLRRGLVTPKGASDSKPVSHHAKHGKRVLKNLKKRDKRFADHAAVASRDAGDPLVVLGRSSTAKEFLQRIENLAMQSTKAYRREGRDALRGALRDAYGGVLALTSLPNRDRTEALASLRETAEKLGGTRTKSADVERIVLGALMAYANAKVSRDKLTRDAQALKYAQSAGIELDDFTDVLSRKGESIRVWADRYAEANRRSRESKAKKIHVEPPAPPAPINLDLTKILKRDGSYVLSLYWDGEELSLTGSRFLSHDEVDTDVLDEIFNQAQNLTPGLEE